MTESTLHCAFHPDRETTLRCNKCEKPICTRCAVLTPVGYRCKECVRGQQSVFETARPLDFVIAAVVSAVGTGIAVALLNLIGWWGFLVAPMVGGGLAEVVRAAVRRRRGRRLPLIAALGGGVGLLPAVLPIVASVIVLLSAGAGIELLGGILFSLLYPLVTGGLLLGALYYRLRGIRL